MKKNIASVIVDILQNSGVKHCYGIVGDTLNYVTDAIHASDMEWIHVRHEEVGGFAAGAESFISGQISACAGSCGPGSLHFINGLYESHRNGAPVILIASQLATDVNDSSFPQYVDFKKVYSECSVFCEEISSPEKAIEITKNAISAALSQKGVAVIILPVNISKSEIEYPSKIAVNYHPPQVIPTLEDIKSLADLLNKGKKIGIYAGIGSKDARDELLQLAEKLQAPIAHTSRVKDFIEYDNPYNVGMTGMLGIESGFTMLKNCNVLLLLGTDFAWPQFFPKKATIIQVDINSANIGKRHSVHLGINGGVKETLLELLPLIEKKTDDGFLHKSVELHKKTLKKINWLDKGAKSKIIHPQYLVQLLDKHADEDAIFTADGGSAMVWLLRYINTNGQRRTLTSLKHGTMANAMPQALGLKKAFPERQIISISGDGGLAMLLGDLLTMTQEKLAVKVVVINNKSLNFVELEQKVEGLLNNYTNLDNPDFSKLATSLGIFGESIESPENLEESVIRFLNYDGPAVLDVHTSPNELVMPPNVELNSVVGMGLYTAKAILHGRSEEAIGLIVDNFIRK
ncbi:thiamine pyrophosphate-dependent enzyme [Xenorhabdus sp. KJ12.1]|uniref:thiamine pyrophosphate-dependent enzyme n=1 Tax=Xenorhabdus sp. KJ12.1 TaxID=1851571 RepID=UPI000C0442E6|nr:thiamine pyrophosphate-dependent enzyme [Xenorhabdus sp. KJ12.1]PHM69658.1 pyruvate oxidase [Xenorhabdus sp. KJ12.1]